MTGGCIHIYTLSGTETEPIIFLFPWVGRTSSSVEHTSVTGNRFSLPLIYDTTNSYMYTGTVHVEAPLRACAMLEAGLHHQSKHKRLKMATRAPDPPEAVVADNTALEKMREELTRMLCTDLFTTPKTLPCLHTF